MAARTLALKPGMTAAYPKSTLETRGAPLAELALLSGKGATGEFICVTPELETHVYLQRGRIAWATSSSHPFEFSRFIQGLGKVDNETFRQVLTECRREKLPVGEALVAWGLVTMDDVKAALRHQVTLACGLLERVTSAQTMFLERQRFTEYNAELTLDFHSVVSRERSTAPPPPESGAREPEEVTPAVLPHPLHTLDGGTTGLLGRLPGGEWVELFYGARLLDSAPAGEHQHVTEPFVRHTVLDSADFVSLRQGTASLFGLRREDDTSVWCCTGPGASYGAALSVLRGLQLAPPWEARGAQAPSRERPVVVGDASSIAAQELRLVMGFNRDVLAAFVLSFDGAPRVGAFRPQMAVEEALVLARRRVPALREPVLLTPRRASKRGADGAFTQRQLLTGEPSVWCFGGEVAGDRGDSLWVITSRHVLEGLGWACLTALTRGLARHLHAATATS